MECLITKSAMWDILGVDCIPFAAWVASGTPEAMGIKFIIENAKTIDLNSTLMQQIIFPYLLLHSVITQATLDRINAYTASHAINSYVPYV
jgi:hypothetical protein